MYINQSSPILFLFCLAICFGCGDKRKKSLPPNIVWITSEDNSKHYLKLFDDNGVSTPNIEKLAHQGLIFKNVFSNGAVCSVARSTIISGCYSPRIGAQFHRKYVSVPMPDSLKMFPYYLRQAGYYTTNNHKKDYNIIENEQVWDESSKDATWRKRGQNQSFFHVYNIDVSHESSLHFKKSKMDSVQTITDPNSFKVQPNHPDTKIFRYTNARYRDKIMEMDQKVGEIVSELDRDGLLDDTFIFYFGDHGGALPGSKGYLYETGLHVPLVIHVPKNYKHLARISDDGVVQAFISFIDFAPTVLALADISTPVEMDGKAFLGKEINNESVNDRNLTFSYADRFDEKYDFIRAIRKGKYKYIRNFQPFYFDGLVNNYRYRQLAYQQWKELYEKGKLNDVQSSFFTAKEPELLFDVEADPFETINLARNEKSSQVLIDMRKTLNTWIREMPDLSFYPEYFLIDSVFSNPKEYGQKHKREISKYIDVVNLSLSSFDEVQDKLIQGLSSIDRWERYWALIACTSFGEKAAKLEPLISRISKNDSELINRVKAFEFLAITCKINPVVSMTKCLYDSNRPTEALLILQSIVLMESLGLRDEFEIEFEKISETVRNNNQVKSRLKYLKVF